MEENKKDEVVVEDETKKEEVQNDASNEDSKSSPENTITAFEVEKIVEMKVNEMLSKLKNADDVKEDEDEEDIIIEF